jgi:hypothetical protein
VVGIDCRRPRASSRELRQAGESVLAGKASQEAAGKTRPNEDAPEVGLVSPCVVQATTVQSRDSAKPSNAR